MAWQAIVALVVAVPVALVAVAFVWYLNVSGLYRVIRATRQREKRRAEARALALREAQQIIRGTATVGQAAKTEEQMAETTGPRGAA
jgi:hypothetical protein